MIPIYVLTNKFLKLTLQFIFFLQIAFMGLILLTASYWFFDLIGLNFLLAIEPLAIAITKFMHTFYHQQVEVSGQFFDGSLLLFDLILLALIFGLAKLKYYINIAQVEIDNQIKICKNRIEVEFNKQLQKETERRISKLKHAAILVEFELRDCQVNEFWGGDKNAGVKENTDEAFKDFQTALRCLPNCKLAKTDNKMLILNEDFNEIEKTLDVINNSVVALKRKFKRKRWIFNYYAGIDIYGDNINVKEIYPTLQNLLNLKIQNEILTLGNFTIRYDMLNDQTYDVLKKGHYALKDQEDVSIWSIIKKF